MANIDELCTGDTALAKICTMSSAVRRNRDMSFPKSPVTLHTMLIFIHLHFNMLE